MLSLLLGAALLDTAAAGPVPTANDEAAGAAAAPTQEIVVRGTRRRQDDILGDVSVLGGADLAVNLHSTIGETLARQPGVSTSGSGPNVARPVLRGLSGDRILILVDGIGSLDVSAVSSDHAVAINPLTADSIEVLHGPAALLYGASAIGGVVNVIDARIPRKVPVGPVHVSGLLGYGTAAHEKLANGLVDVPLGGHFVAHGDINWSRNGDLRTGGYILSKPLRAQAAASPDLTIRDLANLKGDLPNSDGRSFEAAGALAYVDGGLNIGASVTRHTAFYGVPVRYALDPTIADERTHIDVHQTRYDARAEIPLSGFFGQVKARGAYSDYDHQEIAADGAVGSHVFAKGGEGRIELVQRDHDQWGGTSGVQYLNLHGHIDGDEQYLPPTVTRRWSAFTLQHIDRGPLRLEAGARVERSTLTAAASAVVGNPDLSRRFTSLSLSAGTTYQVTRDWKLGLNVTRGQRAPSVDELYANGPHGGNASFEIGDRDLGLEKSLGFEASVRHKGNPVDLSLTVYGSRFSNFLYQVPTREIRDNLPVYQFRQGRANYLGFELQADAPLGILAGIDWTAEASADATRVTIRGFGPAPLIPPLRLLGSLNGKRGAVSGRLEVERDFAHNRTAPLETDTPGFTLVNAGIDWQPLKDRPDLTLALALNNIFDVEARRSTGLLKDYAPLAGRDLRLTARFAY